MYSHSRENSVSSQKVESTLDPIQAKAQAAIAAIKNMDQASEVSSRNNGVPVTQMDAATRQGSVDSKSVFYGK